MRAAQVMVVWALVGVTVVALAVATGSTWYEFSAENPANDFQGPFASSEPDVPAQDFLIHTSLDEDVHQMEAGGRGDVADFEEVPFVSRLLSVVRPLFYLGMGLVAVGVVGALFRLRGVVDSTGTLASVAFVGVLALAASTFWFAGGIADSYEDELSYSGDGQFERDAPELSFFTASADSPEGTWTNVTTAPQLGWWMSLVATGCAGTLFAMVFAVDLRTWSGRRRPAAAPTDTPEVPR